MKKNIFKALGVIVLLFIIFILGILIFKHSTSSNNTNNVVNSEDLSVNFKDNSKIEIKNILPVSDTLGITFDGSGTADGIQGYSEFAVENLGSNKNSYEIYIKKIDNDNEINGNYVKFYLTDDEDVAFDNFNSNILPTYNTLSTLSDKPDSKLLYSGTIDSNDKINFKLRVWLSDSYAVSDDLEVFDFEIFVRFV
jgi:hypothetical protein